MRILAPVLFCVASVALAPAANAVEFTFDGYVDGRLIAPADERGWLDGGLGKTRFGGNDSPDAQLAEIFGQGRAQITSELSAIVGVRVEQEQRTFADVLEAYLRYRPVSTTAWRFSVKAGAFFPPISLENDELGWTSTWTLTPSAINSWVGDELRTLGAEATVEYRYDTGTISVYGAALGVNDPAGVLIAARGWALDDRPTGLLDHPRMPDAQVRSRGGVPPDSTPMFKEIDNKLGWYAGATLQENGIGKIQVLRYDNNADPTVVRSNVVAWLTKFWSAGAQTDIAGFTLMAQAMRGYTYIEPSPFFESKTYFNAAYGLIGYDMGEWRLAGRFDRFYNTQENSGGFTLPWAESGHAWTAALSWEPEEWLRVTAELMQIDSTRRQRLGDGLDPHQTETQSQLSARFYF